MMKSYDLSEFEELCDNLAFDELRNEITSLFETREPLSKVKLTYALGTYMSKLQEENSFAPVLPMHLSPLSREDLKIWGFDYAKRVLLKYGGLERYQTDAALIYTQFQPITEEQWAAISTGSIKSFVQFCNDLKASNSSDYTVPDEYKSIALAYIEDYKEGKSALFKALDGYQKKHSGCFYKGLAILIIVCAVLWYFLS